MWHIQLAGVNRENIWKQNFCANRNNCNNKNSNNNNIFNKSKKKIKIKRNEDKSKCTYSGRLLRLQLKKMCFLASLSKKFRNLHQVSRKPGIFYSRFPRPWKYGKVGKLFQESRGFMEFQSFHTYFQDSCCNRCLVILNAGSKPCVMCVQLMSN